jgi:subtilisin family serine protease
LNGGGHLITAAGNDAENLDLPNNHYYPAQYDKRIVVVGALDSYEVQTYFSNYGKVVTRWEHGLMVTGYGITLSGTSQATAIATGKMVGNNPNKCETK